MPADALYSSDMLLVIAMSLMLMLFVLCNSILDKNLTRPIVIIIGLAFIGVGVLGHVYFLDLTTNGSVLVSRGLLSASIFADYSRYKEVFVYLFPAVSAAVGTNVISDALLKHHAYERRFSILEFIKDVLFCIFSLTGFAITIVASVLLFVSYPIPPAYRYFRMTIPRIWRWTQLKFLKLSIISRSKLRKSAY